MAQVTQKVTTTTVTDGQTIIDAGAGAAVGAGAGAAAGGAAAALAGLGLGAGIVGGSSIKVRSINVGVGAGGAGGAGGAAAAGKGKGMSQLKMQAMALGGAGTVALKELAVSPAQVVVSREKEKVALQELNDRFAAYIERVRFLEADNKRLQGIITTLTIKFEELDATLRAIYDAELAAARKALDETTAAKAAVEIKVAGLEAKVAELTALFTAEYEAHSITKESLPKLEKMISERDAQIDFLTKNVSSMEMELARLKAQIATLQKELSFAKQAGDAEVVARVELESLLTTKVDEIAFLTNLYEEKVKALMSIDLGSDAFASAFSNELALALRDIRAEYEAIMEATRTQDTDAWYRAKFNEVMATTLRATTDLAAAKEEVSAARAKYQSLQVELLTLRAQLAAAVERIASLEGEMAAAAAAAALSIEERDGIINGLRASLAEYVIELKALTDLKLALDAEIATYRRLLAGEETRFAQDVLGGGPGSHCGVGLGDGQYQQTSTTIVNPFIKIYAEEDKYYRLAFDHCDADKSGHVTTTELKNAFEWTNKNAFGSRGPRQVSYPYVNAILKRGDVDSSLTLEYPEFCALMRLEKKIFVENAFAKFAGGVLSLDDAINIFKQAGYVFNENWTPFLKQFQQATGQIAVQQLFALM